MVFEYAVPTDMGYLDQEDQQYLQEVDAVKKWWTDSRWRYTKRPYTAEEIIQKRGNLKIEYPSNTQSKKLWKIIEARYAVSSSAVMLDLNHRMLIIALVEQGCFLHIWLS